jgi:hypothetical protein
MARRQGGTCKVLTEEENVAPALEPADAVHAGDGKCEEAGKGAGGGGRGVEEGDAGLDHAAGVPVREDEDGAVGEKGPRKEAYPGKKPASGTCGVSMVRMHISLRPGTHTQHEARRDEAALDISKQS